MQRKNELSFLNIIFCLLVIFIHVASAPVTELLKGSWQYGAIFVPWRLSAFVVQGFIFLSGLKMFLKEDTGKYLAYCKNKFSKIVFPYIMTVVLFYVYFLCRNYFAFSVKDLFGYIIKGDLVSHFYFVIAIVQFYILKPVWTFMVNKISPKIAVIVSIIIMFLCKYAFSAFAYNDRLFTTYLVYWVMGCYAGKHYESLLCHIKKNKMAYISQFAIVAFLEAVISYTQFVYGGMKFLEELHFLYCISAILCASGFATLVSDRVMNKKLLKKIDSSSYYIYLIHPLFIFITDGMLKKYGINDI
ncbi:MAG: acyltransferase, partial [Clostridia bacterium]|nr:acyltransferase [Clostridia bacterium]